jgi:hypothetical protein
MCSRRLFRQRHDQKCYIRQPFAVGDGKGWRSAVLKAVRLPRVPPATPMRWRDADRDFRMSRIDRRFNVLVNAVLAVAVFNVLFGLLYLGPAVALNAYISSCTIFLNCSYAGPIIILLVRGRDTIMLERPDFPLGRIGGYLLNYVSVIYIIVTSAVRGFPLPSYGCLWV